MNARSFSIAAMGVGWVCTSLPLIAAESAAGRQPLLSVSGGQLPTDTASDGATKLSVEEKPELGGKALKVIYASGDAFGDRVSRVTDWKRFVALEFDAYNSEDRDVSLTLTVRHRRTTSYPTRVDVPVRLRPGKSSVKIGIDEMLNVNGSIPDLANVVRWYLACEEGRTPTIHFGDFWLTGAETSGPAPGGADGSAAGTARSYRVRGRIGEMDVDLVVTPLEENGPGNPVGSPPGGIRGDPARLARIRAAKMPPVTRPVMFHTPEADQILSALEVFPADNPWNQLVEDWPLHPDSERIIASIGTDRPLRYNPDMAFILVPPEQERVGVRIVGYPGESDPGPFPIPEETPIEGWPVYYDREARDLKLSLEDVQRDKLGRGGDRHGIVVDPSQRMLYEFFALRRTDSGWEAAQASVFDLKSNALRPDGWTSADAAGLPIFPAVVRHDELERGLVEHALRVTVRRTRRSYVAPATHFASPHENPEYPRMGERIRLRKDYDLSGFSPEVRAILTALKRYGMLVADNGIEWAISVAPDPRIPSLHEELRRVRGAAFEVVVPPD